MADNLVFLKHLFKTSGADIIDYLYDIHRNPWADLTESAFSEAYETLSRNLAAERGLPGLLWLKVVSHFLIHHAETPDWAAAFFETHPPPDPWPLTVRRLRAGRWAATPVWLLLSGKPRRRFFMVGRGPWRATGGLFPDWALGLLDSEARASIENAAAAALGIVGSPLPPEEGFFFFPILSPNETVQITGRSLGLPVAIACAALITAVPSAGIAAASGDVAPDGTIRPVSNLAEKSKHAAIFGHGAFICPAEGFVQSITFPIEMLPAATLEEAVMLNTLYEPGKAESLRLFTTMREIPQRFVSNCLDVPHDWLGWMRNRREKDRSFQRALLTHLPLLSDLVRQFEKGLEAHHPACPFLANLFTPDCLEDLPDSHLTEKFKWAVLCLSLANHAGQLETAERWAGLADKLTPIMKRFHFREAADFYNHLFIHIHHNRFTFPAELPECFTDVLGNLEALYATQCKRMECETDLKLGALYGTIGQNYAFQGVTHTARALDYFQKARTALGEPAPGLSAEWRRQYAYETYALLDAGKWADAAIGLGRYLGSGWEELAERAEALQPYEHALLARFIADTMDPVLIDGYVPAALGSAPHRHLLGHPWQLWTHNMGRIQAALGNLKTAEVFFRESITRCLGPDVGPTVAVMALLPLSGLSAIGKLSANDLATGEPAVREAMSRLDSTHFEALSVLNFKAMVEAVGAHTHRWFPFSYR